MKPPWVYMCSPSRSPHPTPSPPVPSRSYGGGEGGKEDDHWMHQQLNGHDYAQARGDGEGQSSLVCCSPWVTESDTTEQLNNNNQMVFLVCFLSSPTSDILKNLTSRP